MQQRELEGMAEEAYRAAGFDPSEPAAPVLLANALIGAGERHVVFEADGQIDAAELRQDARGARIVLRARLPARAQVWFVARELARWLLRERGDAARAEVERLAACLRAPRATIRAMTGLGVSTLARRCLMSETAAVLRLGEATDVPVALIAPNREIRVRGSRGPGRLRWTRISLSDDPSRVALIGRR